MCPQTAFSLRQHGTARLCCGSYFRSASENTNHKSLMDIATGGGHTALAFAPYVRAVVATDLTPRMIEVAEAFIREQGAANVTFQVADAEALPFPNASFEIVTT